MKKAFLVLGLLSVLATGCAAAEPEENSPAGIAVELPAEWANVEQLAFVGGRAAMIGCNYQRLAVLYENRRMVLFDF